MMFVIVPGKPGLVIFLMLNTAVASAAIFGLRGIYYALLEEGGVPLMLTGTVTGIVSVIGYTPDIYMPMLGGLLLDRYPGGLGYKYFFGCIAGLGFLGLIAALMIRKISYRIKINQNIL